MWAALGLALLGVVMRVDYRTYQQPALIWSALGVVGWRCVAVLFRAPINGTRRWFGVGGFGVQPSELAKLAAIFFTAALLERRMHRIDEVRYSLLPIGARRRRARRAGPARAGLRHRGLDCAGRRADGLRGRAQLPVHRRCVLAGAAGGYVVLMSADYRRERLTGVPVIRERSARRRIPDAAVADRRRHRRRHRQGADGRRAEAVLPARAAHRLHLRGHRRGARTGRHDADAARVSS